MMPIRVLSPGVVSKIAAGEVIERPASVAKELVENSLDAGAKQVSLEVLGGGIELIKVSDDGAGIPTSEVELAFQRHATSKISNSSDLENISSLGFRGEALPSIAAVAEVEISTRALLETLGSHLYWRNGNVAHKESCARPQGTTVIVRRLFRTFPARLKFLKAPNRENSHIANVVSQYALAFPEVKFSLLLEGHLSLLSPGNGNLRDGISQVYSLEVARNLLEVEVIEGLTQIKGLISPPSLARSNRNYFSFFVNRRWVRSPLLVRAVEAGYHGLLMKDKHPIAVINISVPAQELDVNIHPTKAEVKFRNEQSVFVCLSKAVERTLAGMPIASTRDVPVSFSPFPSWREGPESESTLHPSPLPGMIKDREPTFIAPLVPQEVPVLRVIGQLANTYIIAEGPEGLYLVDQHAAHERILYERILTQWSQRQVEVQGLLQPLTIKLSPRQEETLRNKQEILTQFGLLMESFGDRSYLIRTVPAIIAEANPAELIWTLLDNLGGSEDHASWEEKIAESLACHSAIRAGQQLCNEEMLVLIRQMEQAHQSRSCPHGRPTMIHISLRQLEREFCRRS